MVFSLSLYPDYRLIIFLNRYAAVQVVFVSGDSHPEKLDESQLLGV